MVQRSGGASPESTGLDNDCNSRGKRLGESTLNEISVNYKITVNIISQWKTIVGCILIFRNRKVAQITVFQCEDP